MRRATCRRGVAIALAAVAGAGWLGAQPGDWTLLGWNDLGMHCMDSDFAVFSILPPYNVLHAQLLDASGQLVDPPPAGVTVTYEAVADPAGSENRTSTGKTNFWQYVQALFGVSLPPDEGLAGYAMPGPGNTPRAMAFSAAAHGFVADGVPITPWDDAAQKNEYPLLRLVARNAAGQLLAETRIVAPVSDEMDCRTCHASGSVPAAEPPGGWVFDPDPERDVRLNVLRLHDGLESGDPAYAAALALAGYDPAGLYAQVTMHQSPILCARCHASNALPGTGFAGIAPLTRAVHSRHAGVLDPLTGQTLDASTNRTACYRCHPGSETRCLRGAMGKAVAADGAMAMQCQSCHGAMSRVGGATRVGWLEQPACQSCHTGTATHNNGQIRYDTVFEAGGEERIAVDSTFATQPDVPAPGFDLYRFSVGHGGLSCEACHGSTHAEFPSFQRNDNLASELAQGHAGVLAECTACHAQTPETVSGGPHGLHPIGQSWIGDHEDAAQGSPNACQSCHGTSYRGTVLSTSQADWVASTEFGSKHFWRGFRIGCYACHNGPTNDEPSPNHPAVVQDGGAATPAETPVEVALGASDADGDPLELRIVSQPAHGTVGIAGSTATYFPEAGYAGADQFTFAAWDGWTDSNLATVTLLVSDDGCQLAGCVFHDGFESGSTGAWSAVVP